MKIFQLSALRSRTQLSSTTSFFTSTLHFLLINIIYHPQIPFHISTGFVKSPENRFSPTELGAILDKVKTLDTSSNPHSRTDETTEIGL
jgi:hypothetical protein